MKNNFSQNQKTELRERLMHFLSARGIQKKLPPERELSEALGVNRYLLRSCIDTLIEEHLIIRKPRQGTFLRSHTNDSCRIGLVLADGQSSAYVDDAPMLSGILAVLHSEDCIIRLLNFFRREQLPDLCRQYGLDGCIWLLPGEETIQYLAENKTACDIVLTTGSDPLLISKIMPHNFVALDFENMSRSRAEYFIGRKHTRVAYLSQRTRTYDIFRSVFAAHGLPWEEEWLIAKEEEIPEKLPRIVKKYGINAVLCNGYFDTMFQTLNKMPEFRPDLSIENVRQVRTLSHHFPNVKINFMFEDSKFYKEEMGRQAALMMMRAIREEQTQKPVLVLPNLHSS